VVSRSPMVAATDAVGQVIVKQYTANRQFLREL
jgi:hypothetical protein